MLFNSIHFLLFFPIVILIYFAIPHRYRWILLLTASYYFYMCWKVEYILLIITSTLIDYYAGIQMGKTHVKRKRKKYLVLSLLTNLGLLFSFKYFNFLNESMRAAFDHFNLFYNIPYFNILLPVGISFYTFQTLSYSIDVYRGKIEPERHLGIFALYVAFFPQLVAGPIERSSRLLPQFYKKFNFDGERITSGLTLLLWGFFKKLVIADRLAIVVDAVFNNQANHSGVTLAVVAYLFTIQIYCDFSGYSDIAIGAARIMGFNLMTNFKNPFLTKSIDEFWKRNHISLSSWFRDYLYIALGGNRVSKWRWYFNIFITFVISGIWHGANWTFAVWGAIHGFYLIFSIWIADYRKKLYEFLGIYKIPRLHKFFAIIITFTLHSFSMIFFRALSISDAFDIIRKIFTFEGSLFIGDASIFVYSMFAVFFLFMVEVKQDFFANKLTFLKSGLGKQFMCVVLLIIILLIGVFDGGQFIYFQF
ncbi:MAG: MBOAT family protein [candidate division Zixibacteria bacterium]|nr:MBOAT family protein [candidate division Zixibacteria bacterium]